MGKKLARATQYREQKNKQPIQHSFYELVQRVITRLLKKSDLAQMFGQNKSAIIEISKNDVACRIFSHSYVIST